MERMLFFDIAKKLSPPDSRTRGMVLKSLSADRRRAVLTVSTGGKNGNDRVRSACDDYRLRTASDIRCTVRGKSAEVAVEDEKNALAVMLDFAGGLPLVQEDVLDCLSFFSSLPDVVIDGESVEAYGADCDEGAFRLSAGLLRRNDTEDPDADAEAAFSGIMEILEPHGMGIVKSMPRSR